MAEMVTSADDLLQQLKEKGQSPPSYTQAMLEKIFKKNSEEIESNSLKLALSCPLGKMRIQVSFILMNLFLSCKFYFSVMILLLQVPCRPQACLHIQCFDALLFLKANASKQMWLWKCPICNGKAPFDDLRLDGFIHLVLQSKRLPEDAQEIVLYANASWKPFCSKDVAQIIEIDLTKDSEDIPSRIRHPSMEINQQRRIMQLKVKKMSQAEILQIMNQISQDPKSDEDQNECAEDEIPELSEYDDSSAEKSEDEFADEAEVVDEEEVFDEDEFADEDEVIETFTLTGAKMIAPVTADKDLDEIPISGSLPFLEEDVPIKEVTVLFSMLSIKYL